MPSVYKADLQIDRREILGRRGSDPAPGSERRLRGANKLRALPPSDGRCAGSRSDSAPAVRPRLPPPTGELSATGPRRCTPATLLHVGRATREFNAGCSRITWLRGCRARVPGRAEITS